MGVKTPNAAAVAAATAGFARDVHMMNGGMFANGALSMMFALGGPSLSTLGESTISVDGPVPKLHCIIAPIHTSCAMSFTRKFNENGKRLLDKRTICLNIFYFELHGEKAIRSRPKLFNIFMSMANIIMISALPDIGGA